MKAQKWKSTNKCNNVYSMKIMKIFNNNEKIEVMKKIEK